MASREGMLCKRWMHPGQPAHPSWRRWGQWPGPWPESQRLTLSFQVFQEGGSVCSCWGHHPPPGLIVEGGYSFWCLGKWWCQQATAQLGGGERPPAPCPPALSRLLSGEVHTSRRASADPCGRKTAPPHPLQAVGALGTASVNPASGQAWGWADSRGAREGRGKGNFPAGPQGMGPCQGPETLVPWAGRRCTVGQ